MDGRMIGQAEIDPYLTENTIVVLLAFLCGVIALVGFVSILPWDCMLRSYDSYMTARLANTGLNNKFTQSIPLIVYSSAGSELGDLGVDAECPICLAEFTEGEKLRVLPKCNHIFHRECVDKWLGSHSSCPSCRNCLLLGKKDQDQRRSQQITDIVIMK